MSGVFEQKDTRVRYDEFPKWGKPADDANRERVEQTRQMIPEDVHTLLDLGCGDGLVTNELVELGIDVVGTDFSPVALKFVAGKRVTSSVDAIPFPDGYFDLVLCAETIEHLPDGVYENALCEMERVARRYIIISTPHDEYLRNAGLRCEKCGRTFHRNLHLRSFNRNLDANLFRSYELKKTIGVGEYRQLPRLIDFQLDVLKVHMPPRGAICPFCNHENNKPASFWQRLVLEAVRRITRLIPGTVRDRWIVSLYERRNEEKIL